MKCMFCEKEIQDYEDWVPSPFHDGTDAHTICGNLALRGKDIE